MSEATEEEVMEIAKIVRPIFVDWVYDRAKRYPTKEMFRSWRNLRLVAEAEEGWAPTSLGRRVASVLGDAK